MWLYFHQNLPVPFHFSLNFFLTYYKDPELDPDPHSFSKLDPYPDPHKVNADPKHWLKGNERHFAGARAETFGPAPGRQYNIKFYKQKQSSFEIKS
jgi:hypothetical protein